MESAAIIVGVVLGKLSNQRPGESIVPTLKLALHEACLGRSVMLVGALLIGFLSGTRGYQAIAGSS